MVGESLGTCRGEASRWGPHSWVERSCWKCSCYEMVWGSRPLCSAASDFGWEYICPMAVSYSSLHTACLRAYIVVRSDTCKPAFVLCKRRSSCPYRSPEPYQSTFSEGSISVGAFEVAARFCPPISPSSGSSSSDYQARPWTSLLLLVLRPITVVIRY